MVSVDRPDRVALLDVGVEGVVEIAEVRPAHPRHVRRRLGVGGEHVAFEAVQRLDRQRQPRRLVGHRPVRLDQPAELVLGRPAAGEDAERLVERPAEHLGPERVGAVEQPVEMRRRRPPRSAGSAEIGLWAAPGITPDRRRRQPLVGEPAPQPGVVLRVALEHRHLDAVIARRLDPRRASGRCSSVTCVVQSSMQKPAFMAQPSPRMRRFAASSVPPAAKSSKAFSVTRMMWCLTNSAPSRAPSSGCFSAHSHSTTAQPSKS